MSTSVFNEHWFDIEKLDATNWWEWKFCTTAIFRERELLDLVNGKIQRPEAANDEERASEAFQEKESKWLKADESARNQMILTVGRKDVLRIGHMETAKEAWDTLVMAHEPDSGPLSVLAAFWTLFKTVADENTNIGDHLRELERARDQLTSMQAGIPDWLYAVAMLISLPPSWDSFTAVYYACHTGKVSEFSSREVERDIRNEWRRRNHMTNSGSMSSGTNGVRTRSNVVCENCGRRGHTRERCWHKGGGAFGKGPKR